MTERHIAIYVRVSTDSQDANSQERELKAWADKQAEPVKWYRDQCSGKRMDGPGWVHLYSGLSFVSTIAVWRLDRMGRSMSGLAFTFEWLQTMGVKLFSLRDGWLDLSTPAGRLQAHTLAAAAQYEADIRDERIKCGISSARAQGKTWGGSKKGRRVKVTAEQIKAIHRLKQEGESIMAIRRTTGLSRPTIYGVLRETG